MMINFKKITPNHIFDFLCSRIERFSTIHYDQKAQKYIEKSKSSVVSYVRNDSHRTLADSEVLAYLLSTRYRQNKALSNRHMPYRWAVLAEKAYEISENDFDWKNSPTVLIVGAGNKNPYALALFFLLYGASKVYCLEPAPVSTVDVMSRLYETACQLGFGVTDAPHNAGLNEISKHLDLKSLAIGDFEKVIKNNSIEILQGIGEDIKLDDNSIDFIYSRAVLEHVKDINQVYAENARLLTSGGCMVHHIDMSSHNANDPVSMYYNQLPELSEFDHLNKKRLSDHVKSMEVLGFKVDIFEKEIVELRDEKLRPDFQMYSKEDLEVISATLFAKNRGVV